MGADEIFTEGQPPHDAKSRTLGLPWDSMLGKFHFCSRHRQTIGIGRVRKGLLMEQEVPGLHVLYEESFTMAPVAIIWRHHQARLIR